MIWNLFLNLVYALVYVITLPIRLLPDINMDSNFASAMTTASSYLKSLDGFLPITNIISMVKLYVGIELGYLTYKGIMWFIKRFPTQS